MGCPFADNGDPLTHWTPTPSFRCAIDLTVREKWIRHLSDLLALARHHIHRVVQKNAADLGCGLRHENPCAWKASHAQRQSADVVLMRVPYQNRLDLAVGNRFEIRQRIFP